MYLLKNFYVTYQIFGGSRRNRTFILILEGFYLDPLDDRPKKGGQYRT